MTTANKITLTRIAMIPFFIYFAAQPMLNVEEYKVGIFSFPTCTLIALILFCVASFTDFLDGYVARKYNQVTDFGKFIGKWGFGEIWSTLWPISCWYRLRSSCS